MSIADIKKTAEQKMARSVEALKSELHKVRTGRAHPGILDQVHIEGVEHKRPAELSGGMRRRVVLGEDEGTLVHV